MRKFILIGFLFVCTTLQLAVANGRGVIVLLEGEAGKGAIQKLVSANPEARAFFAKILGVSEPNLLAMDPGIRQSLILSRLEGNGPDQASIREAAARFVESTLQTNRLNQQEVTTLPSRPLTPETQNSSGAGKSRGRLPVPTDSRAIVVSPKDKAFVEGLERQGLISAETAREFKQAIASKSGVISESYHNCVEGFVVPENKVIFLESVVAGERALARGENPMEATANVMAKAGRGATLAQAKENICIGLVRPPCPLYGPAIAQACL